jgi:hypothetical protein
MGCWYGFHSHFLAKPELTEDEVREKAKEILEEWSEGDGGEHDFKIFVVDDRVQVEIHIETDMSYSGASELDNKWGEFVEECADLSEHPVSVTWDFENEGEQTSYIGFEQQILEAMISDAQDVVNVKKSEIKNFKVIKETGVNEFRNCVVQGRPYIPELKETVKPCNT